MTATENMNSAVNNQLVVMDARDSKQQWRQHHSIWASANAAAGGKTTINQQ